MVLYWPCISSKWMQHQIRETEGPKHSWKGWSGQVIFLSFGASPVFWRAQIPKEQIDTSPFSCDFPGMAQIQLRDHSSSLLWSNTCPSARLPKVYCSWQRKWWKIQLERYWKLLMLNNSIVSGSNLLRCFWPWVGKDIVVSNKLSLIFLHSVLYSQTLEPLWHTPGKLCENTKISHCTYW